MQQIFHEVLIHLLIIVIINSTLYTCRLYLDESCNNYTALYSYSFKSYVKKTIKYKDIFKKGVNVFAYLVKGNGMGYERWK